MKITELRCSACDGTLKVDEQNPNFAVCEYCHTKYTIEWDHPGHPGSGDAHLKKMPAKIAYEPIHEPERKTSGWEAYGWKRAIALVILGLMLIIAMNAKGFYQRFQMDHVQEAADDVVKPGFQNGLSTAEAGSGSAAGDGQAEDGKQKLSGTMADFAEVVFGKPLEDISEKELSKIQWIELNSNIDFRRIGYSFEDPLENPDAELTWIEFLRDDYQEADLSCLPAFSGLKRIGTSQYLDAEDTAGLALTGIRGYFDSLEDAAAAVEDPSLIRYLDVSGDPVSLNGLEQFTNLETLILDSDHIEETKNLVNAGTLKSLSIDMYDGKMDFSVLGMMSWLEEVSVSSESIRDLGFISKMSGLKALNVEYGGFLSLAPLKDCPHLEELSIVSCDELKDMSEVSSLTGLKKLKLELPYGCAQPDLSGLTGLRELYLDSFDGTGFLRNMSSLESLTLDSCTVNSSADFEGLTNLKKLSCTSFGASARDYGFITKLPALEDLDLHGTVTYGDISGIFNMPSLKRLNISNMECEINFDRIGENTTLEALSIDSIKLYNNVQVSGGGGITYVDWDDVSFTDHLSFFEKLKGLKELSIRENQLTDLNFASSLTALQTIDFSDNYVTDLSPLSGLKALTFINCGENPISNYEILNESVVIMR